MFPRRKRLQKDAFRAPGKRLSSVNFTVQIPHPPVRGYAVVVSKKTARMATARHKLKRRVLAALQTIDLPPALVVYPRATALSLPAPALRQELGEVIRRARGRAVAI